MQDYDEFESLEKLGEHQELHILHIIENQKLGNRNLESYHTFPVYSTSGTE